MTSGLSKVLEKRDEGQEREAVEKVRDLKYGRLAIAKTVQLKK